MSDTIKVLALDDDNHDVCFVTKDAYYHNAAAFMEACLLKPHTEEYEVRMVALVNFEDEDSEDWNIFESFDRLACIYDPAMLYERDPVRWQERDLSFDIFWEKGDRCFYV